MQTIGNRIRKLEKEHGLEYGEGHPDIPTLEEFSQKVAAITPSVFTKFGRFVTVLTDKKKLFWNGKVSDDRLVPNHGKDNRMGSIPYERGACG